MNGEQVGRFAERFEQVCEGVREGFDKGWFYTQKLLFILIYLLFILFYL